MLRALYFVFSASHHPQVPAQHENPCFRLHSRASATVTPVLPACNAGHLCCVRPAPTDIPDVPRTLPNLQLSRLSLPAATGEPTVTGSSLTMGFLVPHDWVGGPMRCSFESETIHSDHRTWARQSRVE